MLAQITIIACATLTSQTPAQAVKPRVLVLAFEAQGGVTPGEVTLLENAVVSRIARASSLEVISSADMKKLVELEAEKESVGCDPNTSTSCLAEIAGALGAQYVVTGNIGRIGDKFVLGLTLLESAKAQSSARTTIEGESPDALLSQMSAVDDLVAPITGVARPEDGVAPLVLVGVGVAGAGAVAFAVGTVWAGVLESALGEKPGDPLAKESALEQRVPALGTVAGGALLAAVGGGVLAWGLME